MFLHQPREGRERTTSAEHFLWTRHSSKGFSHSRILNPHHSSCGGYKHGELHFTNEKIEVVENQVSSPGRHIQEEAEPGFHPKQASSRAHSQPLHIQPLTNGYVLAAALCQVLIAPLLDPQMTIWAAYLCAQLLVGQSGIPNQPEKNWDSSKFPKAVILEQG